MKERKVGGDYVLIETADGVEIWHGGEDRIIEMAPSMEAAMDRVSMVETLDGDEVAKLECVFSSWRDGWVPHDRSTYVEEVGFVPCEDAVEDYEGEWRLLCECERVDLKNFGWQYILQTELEDEWHWCNECEHYVLNDDYDYEEDMCSCCVDELRNDSSVIGDYHSHNKARWYGSPGRDGRYCGLGFELEVDKNPKSDYPDCEFNESFAEGLMDKSGLDLDECVYEEDGSLSTGFEIISMPHTVKDFWSKKEKWAKMLSLCSRAGFKSHDAGNCGLHVHVSRCMFGRKVSSQDNAVAKVFRFYEDRWDDLLKASRRRNTSYCQKADPVDRDGNRILGDAPMDKWKHLSKQSYHSCAINNTHANTVEFRLCRGTLNPASFFAWIDLTLVIVRNSRKSYAALKDAREWLKGISPYTAEYLVSRGAFAEEIRELMPEAVWARSADDSGEE